VSGFRKFLLRGNVVDLAVGIVIGVAFGAVVTAFVKAFITPLVGLLAGAAGDFSNSGFFVHHSGKSVLFPYGAFVNALVAFVLIAAVVYFLVVVPVNRLMERFRPTPEQPAPTQDCPYCISSIPVAATVCAFCTRDVPGAAPA
jgi:large conductance mechanosensitive channel